MTVVAFGEMLLRLSPPGFERFFQSPALTAGFGGSEANVAISLARFGLSCRYVTRLPANPLGDAAVRVLAAEGVQTGHVVRGGTRIGIYSTGRACWMGRAGCTSRASPPRSGPGLPRARRRRWTPRGGRASPSASI
jgi:hypothetical protein